MRKICIALLSASVVAACAKDSSQVGATYTSPVAYQSYTCPQLAEEAQRISARAAQAAGIQDQKSTNDAIAMTVGLVVVWPALLFIKGNDENTAELARLRGQMDAVEQMSIQKNCGIKFQRQPPPAPPAAYNRDSTS